MCTGEGKSGQHVGIAVKLGSTWKFREKCTRHPVIRDCGVLGCGGVLRGSRRSGMQRRWRKWRGERPRGERIAGGIVPGWCVGVARRGAEVVMTGAMMWRR